MTELDSTSESGSEAASQADSSNLTCWDTFAESLDAIESLGAFATMQQYSLCVNPVLKVHDAIIPLPLTDRDADLIKKLCRQAPYGKGNQTLIDTSVRQTWELSTDHFRLLNPAWDSFFHTILREVRDSLGIVESVDAQPHKLLLYEQGSFFKPHKDSEKAVGMIATLTICLPSAHDGGEVQLSHAGQRQTLSTSDSSLFHIMALAWFSDVTHEVRKVVSGYRLVITYNIIQKSGLKVSAGTFDQQRNAVQRALTDCREQDLSFARKLYVLDHKYSRAGLSLRNLKGRDRAVCESLNKLCSQHGFYLLLGHITKKESRQPDDFVEDTETTLSLDSIHKPDGDEIANHIAFHEGQLINDPYHGSREWDSFEESEHLGNEESPEIFKYHDAVAIICRKVHLASYLHLVDNISLSNIARMVMQDLDQYPNAKGAPSDSLEVMEKIVQSWSWAGLNFKYSGICATVIRWAWERKHQVLYVKAVVSSIDRLGREEGMRAVAKIANAEFMENTDIQWNKYLGSAVPCVQSLTNLTKSLAMVDRALEDDLKSSFTAWRILAEQQRFDSKESLGTQDRGFILDSIMSRLEDSDWATNCLVPALRVRGEKPLITSLVQDLLTNGHDNKRLIAKSIADSILQGTCLKAALQPVDFKGRIFQGTGAYDFIRLLETCLGSGLQDLGMRLLEASCTNINAAHEGSDERLLASNTENTIEPFLHHLERVLRDHQVPYLESLREMFTLLIRRYMWIAVPLYPEKRPGWSHKPRGCRYCKICPALNEFLQAENEQERRFQVGRSDVFHLQYRLPSSIFKCVSDEDSTSDSPITLTVSKVPDKEFEQDVKEYHDKLLTFERPFQGLRQDYLRGLLGEATYRELIMLEWVKDSEGAKQLGATTGTKRTAEMVSDNSEAVRPPSMNGQVEAKRPRT